MRRIWVVCVMTVLLVLSGCDLPDRHAKRKIELSEIIGTWTMTEKSIAMLQADGFTRLPEHQCTIRFAQDGSVQFASVLDEFKGGEYVDWQGGWELLTVTKMERPSEQTNAVEIALRPRMNFTQYRDFFFSEVDGKLVLWSYYSDPDHCDYTEYERSGPRLQ